MLGLVDDAGKRTHTYAYGPTGLPRTTPTEAVPQPFRYTGAYLDPTGLYKMGARYYDPQLGRFTQPDPSGQEKNPLTGGPDAAEAATAGVIADIGVTGLCEAGASFFGGPVGAGTAAPYCAAIGTAAGAYVAGNYQNNLT